MCAQVDIELSFCTAATVQALTEGLITTMINAARQHADGASISGGPVTAAPFPRLSYHDAMALYGSDKPDLRYGLPAVDISSTVHSAQLPLLAGSPVFRAIVCKGLGAVATRKEIDQMKLNTPQVKLLIAAGNMTDHMMNHCLRYADCRIPPPSLKCTSLL